MVERAPLDPSSSPIDALVEQAIDTRHERARAIVQRCTAMLPFYRKVPEAALKTTTASVLHHLCLFYEATLAEDRALRPADLEYSRRIARVSVGAGTPLGEFLAFFDEGLAITMADLTASARTADAREALFARFERVLRYQTQLITALTEAYVQERERLSHFREQDLSDFFELLLQPEGSDGSVDLHAKALGIELAPPHSFVLFQLPGAAPADAANARLEKLRGLLVGALPSGAGVLGRVREGFAALVPGELAADRIRAVTEDLRARGMCIGIGRAGEGAAGVRQSAQEARRALRIGSMIGEGTLYHYDETELLDHVGIGLPSAERFMRRVLASLAEAAADRTDLATLRALVRNDFDEGRTAAALTIDPPTMSDRAEQLRSRYGIDLGAPDARLRIGLALLIRDAMDRAAARAPSR